MRVNKVRKINVFVLNKFFNLLKKKEYVLFVFFKRGVCIRVGIMIFKKFNLVFRKYVRVKFLNGMEVNVYILGEGYNL